MRFLLCLALAACSSPLKAQVALNPYTGRYEIAPHNAVPQLNPFTGNFELASPGSVPKFVTAQVGWMTQARRRDLAKCDGWWVRASMMFQPCFLAVEKKERMRAKSIAPSDERKPPEIF